MKEELGLDEIFGKIEDFALFLDFTIFFQM